MFKYVLPRRLYSSSVKDFNPTIYALSTKPGRSAIGVVRISGTQSSYIYQQLTKNADKKGQALPKHRLSSVRKLYSPVSNLLLDEALTIFFKSPKTYTGEDILELHLHGGTAIIQGVLNSIKGLHDPSRGVNIRYAENGEFSKRAFINGRFDLTEIEGIREMIDAETESQRVAALSSMTGNTKQIFMKWRSEIVKNVALLTTVIDFGEDHDIEEVSTLFATVQENINKIHSEILEYLQRVQRSEILLKGIKLVLLGPPNAGKSSLLNILANKDAAIVSDIAGTTRDVIDVPLDINGFKVVVGDTAGIRQTSEANTIEIEGIKRAKVRSLSGDLILIVLPLDQPNINESLTDHISSLQKEDKKILVVLNKSDLVRSVDVNEFSKRLNIPAESFYIVSCSTGGGIEAFTQTLTDNFKSITLTENNDPVIISARSQDLLANDVLYGFEQFKFWKENDEVVLASESLRQSVEGIGKITGETVGIEEVLDVVFSSFCIGK
ncbi:tRNA modification GTPase Mss1p, mitochondrial [[Candida] railenensis]|uniref:tRNA modification GTPase Mss1p, mitochondrial n=1 Tax=[Candida] railenensis TaxID=45579 RepID=A0A9P0QT22_9ASCO|nr:tRNA modification GTPase Mss1p, mitochondrial [[Candida] railenensis]